jgi:hypothetical protein
MIIVPIEENREGIAGLTDAKFRAPDYSGSGLEALGAGLAKFGESGGQFATALDDKRKRELAAIAAIAAAKLDGDHQSHIDDAAVKQAYVNYSDQTHEALHGDDGLFNQRGAAAHTAFPDLVGKLIDNHDKALAPLDEVQRGAVAPAFGARLRSDVDLAAQHVRAQGKAEHQRQVEKLLQATGRDAVARADDPDLHDHHMATGEKAIRQQGRIKNLPAREVDRQITDYKSAVHADTIDALAKSDPATANAWLDAQQDQMTAADHAEAQSALDAHSTLTKEISDVGMHKLIEKEQAASLFDLTNRPENDTRPPEPHNAAVEGSTPDLLDPQLVSSLETPASVEAQTIPLGPAVAPMHASQIAGVQTRPRRSSQIERDHRRFASSRYAGLNAADREIMMAETVREQQDIAHAAEARAMARAQMMKLAEPPAEPGSFSHGHPVLLPNGKGLRDMNPHWNSKYLMSPTSDLRPVANEGRAVGLNFQRMMANPILSDQAYTLLLQSIDMNVGQGGKFDYQRSGHRMSGFTQLPQFRNVSNFNVGLFMQQTGLFSLDETLRVAGTFAKLFSSNSRSDTPYHLDERTEKWIRLGYSAGETRLYGLATKGTFRAF